MQPPTSISRSAYEKMKLLLLTILTCTIVSACSGGGSSGGDSQSNLPNPYANGFRVVQVITTFSGEPWSTENYMYDQEKRTFVLNDVRSTETFTDIQILNSSGLIERSGKPGEDNALLENRVTRDYSYNERGELISRSDIAGILTFRYIRDEEGKLIERTGGVGRFEYSYDVNGLLETVLDTLTQELYVIEYNAAGQLSGGATSFDDGTLFNGFEVLYDENGNISQVTSYDRMREPIFSDRYIYEETDEVIVNHGLMRLLNALPELTITSF